MEQVWLPILLALIAAIPLYLGVRATRKSSQVESSTKQVELAIGGLATLVNELQEERSACLEKLALLEARIAVLELAARERDRVES